MKKFRIFKDSVMLYQIEIEAETLEEARAKADDIDGGEWEESDPTFGGAWQNRTDLDEHICFDCENAVQPNEGCEDETGEFICGDCVHAKKH